MTKKILASCWTDTVDFVYTCRHPHGDAVCGPRASRRSVNRHFLREGESKGRAIHSVKSRTRCVVDRGVQLRPANASKTHGTPTLVIEFLPSRLGSNISRFAVYHSLVCLYTRTSHCPAFHLTSNTARERRCDIKVLLSCVASSLRPWYLSCSLQQPVSKRSNDIQVALRSQKPELRCRTPCVTHRCVCP